MKNRWRILLNTCHGLPVLGIKCLVNLIKQVEWRRVTLLNGKDERQCDKRFLSTRQLLHVSHLGFVTSKRHLHQHSHIHLVITITQITSTIGSIIITLVFMPSGEK